MISYTDKEILYLDMGPVNDFEDEIPITITDIKWMKACNERGEILDPVEDKPEFEKINVDFKVGDF